MLHARLPIQGVLRHLDIFIISNVFRLTFGAFLINLRFLMARPAAPRSTPATTAGLHYGNYLPPGSSWQPPADPYLVPEYQQASIPRTNPLQSLHGSAWWANATRHFNSKHLDDPDAAALKRGLWRGLMGEEKPYAVERNKTPGSTETQILKRRSKISPPESSVGWRAILGPGNLLK